MNQKVKVAVIGCGQIVQIMHLPYLCTSQKFEVVAICDISKNVLKEVGEKFNIPEKNRFVDFKDVFSIDFDACVIATIDHFSPAILAAKNKKHIFVEKPFAYNVGYIDQILSYVDKYDLVAQIGYMKLYDPAISFTKKLIKNLKNVNMIRIHDFGGSFAHTTELFPLCAGTDVEERVLIEGKNFVRDSMMKSLNYNKDDCIRAFDLIVGITSHDLAVLRYLFGVPEVLFSTVYNDNVVIAQMKYGEIPIQLESGYIPNRPIWDEVFEIYSDEINIKIEFPWPYFKNHPTTVTYNYNDENDNNITSVYNAGFEEAYELQWEDFYNCILTGDKPLADAFSSRADIVIASDLINRSVNFNDSK